MTEASSPGRARIGKVREWFSLNRSYGFNLVTLRSVLIGVLYVISGLMFLRFWFDVG